MSDLHHCLHVIIEIGVFHRRMRHVGKIGVFQLIVGKWIDRQAGFKRKRAGLLWVLGALALQFSCGWFEPPTIVIIAEEFRFIPARIELAPDEPLRLLIRNQGRERHVFHSPELFGPAAAVRWQQPRVALQEANAIVLEPGQSIELSLTLSPGLYPFRCWIKGHNGMEGTILVKGLSSN